ncbi:MAG: hypothetical protein WC714_29030 [Candidatus Obscuribacterales bacterium]|jgi:hypothetical protein
MNRTNEAQLKEGKQRRAKLLKRYYALKTKHNRGAMVLLANEEKVSCQRISWMLGKAKLEAGNPNHIEDGHSESATPLAKFESQKKDWANSFWKAKCCYLDESNRVVKE